LNISKDIFRAYDIRGQYPEEINEELYNMLGKAIGTKILQ
jgi:phosphomannomutase